MLWAAAAFASGVMWVGFAVTTARWTPPNWPIFAAILLLILSVISIRSRPRMASAIALLAIAMLGITQGGLGKPPQTALLPAELDNQQVEVRGFVTRAAFPVLEADTSNSDSEQALAETYQQIDLYAEAIHTLDQDPGRPNLLAPKLGIRIGIYGRAAEGDPANSIQTAVPEFHYGERLRIRGRIRAPQIYGDPGVFDRRGYLLNSGIAATLSTKSTDVEPLPGHWGTRLGSLRAVVRRGLLQHMLALHTPKGQGWQIFSISQTDAALLAAMILGERSLLEQDVKLDFQRTGSYHLLVVSGNGGRDFRVFSFLVSAAAASIRHCCNYR